MLKRWTGLRVGLVLSGLGLVGCGGGGLSEADARTCAEAIMFATLRGLDSHGIVSILPAICNSIEVGRFCMPSK